MLEAATEGPTDPRFDLSTGHPLRVDAFNALACIRVWPNAKLEL